MIQISLITVSNKLPDWVHIACQEFTKRLSEYSKIHCVDIPLLKRGKTNDLSRILEKESLLIQTALPKSPHYLIALDKEGKQYSSEQLSTHLEHIKLEHKHLCFLIGGPEGLSCSLLKQAHERWSFSKLTFPHTLARIMLLETLYRSWTIEQHHPYHK